MVILGILAAFAIPRFISLEGDARTASIKALGGALQGSNALAHSLALVNSQTGATGSVNMDGADVDLVFGYPDATGDGIGNSVSITSDYDAVYAGGVGTYTLDGYTGSPCSVVYTQAADSATPSTILITTTGC